MPKGFRRQWKPTPVRKTVYLEHPVGSNEWTRQKDIEYRRRKAAKCDIKVKVN